MKRALSSRKLAEWITLLVSVTVIASLIVYLAFDLTRTTSPYVELVARPAVDEVSKAGDRYVLPVDIHNRGRAVARANIRIVLSGGEQHDVQIEYLGRGSKTRIYKYLDRDPRGARLTVTPTDYSLD